MVAAWLALNPEDQDLAVPRSTGNEKERLLLELADARIAVMDDVGVDVQVLSKTTPGVQTLDPALAVTLARRANDLVAATVKHRPDRFQGFASIPLGAPHQELCRRMGDG